MPGSRTCLIRGNELAISSANEHPESKRQMLPVVGIRAMPTLMIFKGGQVAASHTGALVQKKRLEDWINGSVAV